MKKLMLLALSTLTLLALLTACGSTEDDQNQAENSDISLNSFYDGLAQEYHWTEDAENSEEGDVLMTPIEGEMLEMYYPGLSDLTLTQVVAKMPMMSSIVNEMIFVQCESEEDAATVAEIFQDRIDYQVGDENNPGGAWYPESIESWKSAQVVQHGTYVAMVASAEHQAEIVEAFDNLFA